MQFYGSRCMWEVKAATTQLGQRITHVRVWQDNHLIVQFPSARCIIQPV